MSLRSKHSMLTGALALIGLLAACTGGEHGERSAPPPSAHTSESADFPPLFLSCGEAQFALGHVPDPPSTPSPLLSVLIAEVVDKDGLYADYAWAIGEVTEDAAVLLGRTLDGSGKSTYADATFVREGGRWRLDKWGGCRMGVVAQGYVSAPWTVDPTHDIDTASSEWPLVIDAEVSCQDVADSATIVPVVDLSADEATIIILIRMRAVPGRGPGCPIVEPYVVDLGEPLGLRQLIDGSSFPPTRRR